MVAVVSGGLLRVSVRRVAACAAGEAHSSYGRGLEPRDMLRDMYT